MSGQAARFAVVGHPVAHSLSPALHRAAHAALGVSASYDAIDVAPGDFDAFVAGLDRTQWRGLSVTMPHKADCARWGAPDDAVGLTGVANTLVLGATPDADRVANTDVAGFTIALAARGVACVDSVIVVGNGATALSALTAARRLGAQRATVTLRSPDRAGDVRRLAAVLGLELDVVRLGQPLAPADLLVSTVPAMAARDHAAVLVHSAPVVFDVVYDPWPTPLAAAASDAIDNDAPRVVLNGLDLLAAQAIDQVRLMTSDLLPGGWPEQAVTLDRLRTAGARELQRRGQVSATLGD